MSNLDIFSTGNAVEAICSDVCIHACLVNTTLPNMDMYTQPCRQLVKDLGRQKSGTRVSDRPGQSGSRVRFLDPVQSLVNSPTIVLPGPPFNVPHLMDESPAFDHFLKYRGRQRHPIQHHCSAAVTNGVVSKPCSEEQNKPPFPKPEGPNPWQTPLIKTALAAIFE